MPNLNQTLVAAVTVAIALGIGMSMQDTDAMAARVAPGAGPIATASLGFGVPHTPARDHSPNAPAPDVIVPIVAKPAAPAATPADTVEYHSCEVALKAQAVADASVDLSVTAPCKAGARASVHHRGLVFATLLDALGQATVTVPALSRDAQFIVAFEDQTGASLGVTVDGLDRFDRVALQWQGGGALRLRTAEDAGAGTLVRLGDPALPDPMLAEIYTRRVDAAGGRLSAEVEITDATCGRVLSAQSFEHRAGGPLRTRDLSMTVPGCKNRGGVLILQNLLGERIVAAQ